MLLCYCCAMYSEANPLLEKVETIQTEKFGFASLHECLYQGHKLFVAVCGIGKVLSASGLAGIIVAHPEIEGYVNLGIGGSLDAEKAPLLSAVIGKGFVQHDIDTSPIGDPKAFLSGVGMIELPGYEPMMNALEKACELQGLSVYKGVIASGDQFIIDEEIKSGFVKDFGAISVDMEGAAYAEVAHVYNKPFAALRIISDAVDHQAEYIKYKDEAARIGSEVALKLFSIEL